MGRLIELLCTAEQAELVVAALLSSKGDRAANAAETSLGRRFSESVRRQTESWAAQDAVDAAEAARLAERAVNAVLTPRQAMALAARRAGKTFGEIATRYSNDHVGWKRGRSMGGAIRRMGAAMVEEGLVDPKRWEPTEAGLARLAAFEAKHPTFRKLIEDSTRG